MEKLQANLKQEQVLQSELSMEVFERVSLRVGMCSCSCLRIRLIALCCAIKRLTRSVQLWATQLPVVQLLTPIQAATALVGLYPWAPDKLVSCVKTGGAN